MKIFSWPQPSYLNCCIYLLYVPYYGTKSVCILFMDQIMSFIFIFFSDLIAVLDQIFFYMFGGVVYNLYWPSLLFVWLTLYWKSMDMMMMMMIYFLWGWLYDKFYSSIWSSCLLNKCLQIKGIYIPLRWSNITYGLEVKQIY